MQIINLAPIHAADAARLHIAGQPGTFLTRLGPQVLTVFYRTLPQSPVGFGFAAVELKQPAGEQAQSKIQNPKSEILLGFVSATCSTGQLFFELGAKRLGQFLPPLLARFAQQPSLILHCMQTVFYPLVARRVKQPHAGTTAELLSIMVEPDRRSQGVGKRLMERLLEECHTRQIGFLNVTVAAENQGAQRFYVRHGFQQQHCFTLYGRVMCSYQCKLT